MAVKAISGSDKDQELIIDTLKHARRQEYTPQRLCELQKIIETQYYYWWIMDMKKEEFCLELFDEDFQYYYNGYLASTKPEEQARTSNGSMRLWQRCIWAISLSYGSWTRKMPGESSSMRTTRSIGKAAKSWRHGWYTVMISARMKKESGTSRRCV